MTSSSQVMMSAGYNHLRGTCHDQYANIHLIVKTDPSMLVFNGCIDYICTLHSKSIIFQEVKSKNLLRHIGSDFIKLSKFTLLPFLLLAIRHVDYIVPYINLKALSKFLQFLIPYAHRTLNILLLKVVTSKLTNHRVKTWLTYPI